MLFGNKLKVLGNFGEWYSRSQNPGLDGFWTDDYEPIIYRKIN